MNYQDIGNLICTLRKKQKLTQSALADKIGTTFQTVSKWENGNSIPDISLFPILCKVLNITTDELITGKINKKRRMLRKLNKIINIILIILLPVFSYFTYFYICEHNSFNLYDITSSKSNINGLIINKNNKYLYLINCDKDLNYYQLDIYVDSQKILTTSSKIIMFSTNKIFDNLKIIIDDSKSSIIYILKVKENTINIMNTNYINNKLFKFDYSINIQTFYEENDLTYMNIIYNNYLDSTSVTVMEKNSNIILEKYDYNFKTDKLICEIGTCSSYKNIASIIAKN